MVSASSTQAGTDHVGLEGPAPKPRFGGVLWRISRFTIGASLPLAGKPWNPIFAVVEHRGRKTGRSYRTPVAARRTDGGFIISLAFGRARANRSGHSPRGVPSIAATPAADRAHRRLHSGA